MEMKTKDIIVKIKNTYLNTINIYENAIINFTNQKKSYRNRTREELQSIKPSLSEYDIAIRLLEIRLNEIKSDVVNMDLNINDDMIENFDYLMDCYDDINCDIITIIIDYLAQEKNINIIDNKSLSKLKTILSQELLDSLALKSRNEKDFELQEVLKLHNCSKESMRSIFKTIKNTILPKEPKRFKDKMSDIGYSILSISSKK